MGVRLAILCLPALPVKIHFPDTHLQVLMFHPFLSVFLTYGSNLSIYLRVDNHLIWPKIEIFFKLLTLLISSLDIDLGTSKLYYLALNKAVGN